MVVRCKTISDLMRGTHGEHAFLELPLARDMERKGLVKIDDPLLKTSHKSDIDYLTRTAFTGRGATTIAWIQDHSKIGGAELSNNCVVDVGTRLGFDIVGVTPSNFNTKIVESADVVIINNFFEFGPDNTQRLLKIIYERNKPFIKYEHDHREITERKPQASRLFNASSLNVFISPLQMNNHVRELGDGLKKNSVALPLAINVFNFIDQQKKRSDSIFVPGFAKCRANVTRWIAEHPNDSYTVVGYADIPNAKVKTLPVQTKGMVDLYNDFKTVLHLPDKIGGGERVVFEAVLCGCNVIHNGNVSHATWSESFDWKNKDILREKLFKAPYEFWRLVWKLKQ